VQKKPAGNQKKQDSEVVEDESEEVADESSEELEGSEESWEDEWSGDDWLGDPLLSKSHKHEKWLDNNRDRLIYLSVPFNDRDEAQNSGARFDGLYGKWYIKPGQKRSLFKKWLSPSEEAKRIYLKCPFSDKEDAKALGARFDGDKKKWYIVAGMDLAPFSKWLSKDSESKDPADPAQAVESEKNLETVDIASEKTYLKCPFADNAEVKELGAFFDGDARRWYISTGTKLSLFAKWLPQMAAAAAIEEPPKKKARTEGPTSNGTAERVATSKTYLKCPFSQKDEVKALGARWEPSVKKWYVDQGASLTPFAKWLK
jgi:hypothetical protein